MQYGICNLSIISLRLEPKDTSEQVSQVLYGEHFKVLERRKKWSRIRLAFDKYEGWVDNKQYLELDEESYKEIDKKELILSPDVLQLITDTDGRLSPIPLGASVHNTSYLGHRFDGPQTSGEKNREALIETAFMYLNAPYQWGGKTPFGIDCSGFTQMVYKLNGFKLLRDASQQATQGEALSFIEESTPGDLAFFDNDEGNIIHVGIIMENNYIIHAHGKVRIDRIDHTGIFNVDTRRHSHQLRVIKKIID
ncbi:NlpC/P60 family protein [Sungkyunkwania multivorans]|uniref:NlpC/P60 family protein n=1 Tax=Sungkyunkwania multivorans TaxID=1173618 RepID=A0ABW3CUL4_9FLAO